MLKAFSIFDTLKLPFGNNFSEMKKKKSNRKKFSDFDICTKKVHLWS